MKKVLVLIIAICLLLSGCAKAQDNMSGSVPTEENTAVTEAENDGAADAEQTAGPKIIYPLPDTTMGNISDCILYVSLEEGGVYLDDTGKILMDIKIYSYDSYDLVDMSMMKTGDILSAHSGEVKLGVLVRNDDGSISVNGGLDAGGFDLVCDDCGCFYERGYNDAKNWYEVGEASIPVSADFEYHDNSDLDHGETLYYPENFLAGEVTDYHFTPHNTTVRVENGQIIEMYRRYVP